MGFLSGIFGKSSEWDGSHYIASVCGQKFWHKAFIDKDNAIEFGRRLAFEVDPMGPRIRSQDVVTLMGELIYYFNICEERHDETALRYISRAMKKYVENHPDQNAIVYFTAKTNYLIYH
jgi:hypothetical protein